MPFIGQQPTTGAFLELDSLTASATANYTLQLNGANYYPESVNNLLVSINGVIQGSSTMSLNGAVLTVGATLSASDVIDFVRVFGNVGTISTPTDGSVTANKIGTGAVNLTSKVTGVLPVANGGTGVSSGFSYAEGTWTATITGESGSITSYSVASATYTKIGNAVHIHCRFTVSDKGTGTNFVISGLPFASERELLGTFAETNTTGLTGFMFNAGTGATSFTSRRADGWGNNCLVNGSYTVNATYRT